MSGHRFNYNWKLSDGYPAKNGMKVFSCFSCGGGSTMGYKLAGYEVIGCNEIDPKMMKVYRANHNPRYSYLEGIQTFKNRPDLPDELFDLDILDGSPPCSSFSMAGSREEDWGKEKKFREGQSEQVLDTLFFDFIELTERLQPKVVIAENVKGLLLGTAFKYVKEIYKAFDRAGYHCKHFLLDASEMGVPQKRERVFFLCLRKDLAGPLLHQVDMFTWEPKMLLSFKQAGIPFGEIYDGLGREFNSPVIRTLWENRKPGDLDQGDANLRMYGREGNFNQNYVYKDKILGTIASKESCQVLYDEPKYLSKSEVCKGGSYPMDYNFLTIKPHYLIGMSVPPVMMAQVASQVYEQWLSKLEPLQLSQAS